MRALGLRVEALVFLAAAGGGAFGHDGRPVLRGPEPRPNQADLPTLVVLPDTQYYASTYPELFSAQTRWLVEQRAARRLAAVVHLGDIVDSAKDVAQWKVAATCMHALDDRVPYVIVPGNHDCDANRVGPIDDYFAPRMMPWISGTMIPGKIENNYALLDIGPQRWLILGLEFGPRDAVVAWAKGILKAYARVPAILVTHAFLYEDGTRYGMSAPGLADAQASGQRFSPEAFGYTRQEGINDGEQLWEKLIVPNPNVRLVLCGHDNGVARLSTFRPDGTLVHQVLSDYQWLYQGTSDYKGGSGYLRLLQFDYGKQEIRVQTYSPYLRKFLTDDANQFSLSLDLTGPDRIAVGRRR
jgi:3',5'-cyclic AMP phosphodiesterase CpdA